MKLTISRQDSYSRGELLLRSFFGPIYILIPHIFIMLFVNIWTSIIDFIAWWAILFTGKYPKSMFEFMTGYLNWNARLSATLSNLVDGYPAIGAKGTSDKVKLEVEYPASLSRLKLLITRPLALIFVIPAMMFGTLIPRMAIASFLQFLAWWVVLFKGTFPADWHAFIVRTMEIQYEYSVYLMYMTDKFPTLV